MRQFNFALVVFATLLITASSWGRTSFVLNSGRSPSTRLAEKSLSRPRLSSTFVAMAFVGGGGFAPESPIPQKTVIISSSSSTTDLDEQMILQNFNQIQFGQQARIGIIGTSELNENQQQMIELLSYALVLSGNHVFTSGGGNGTNIAVIRGALRACNPDLLSVILPQSLYQQSSSMQTLLSRVKNVIEQPENDGLGLREAAQLCNYKILSYVDKVIVFVYHDSTTILGPLEDFEEAIDIVRFYLD